MPFTLVHTGKYRTDYAPLSLFLICKRRIINYFNDDDDEKEKLKIQTIHKLNTTKTCKRSRSHSKTKLP